MKTETVSLDRGVENRQAPARSRDEWLLRLLLAEAKLPEEAAQAVREARVPYASMELLRRGLLTKQDLADAVSKHYQIAFAEPAFSSIDKMALSLLPEALCRKHLIVPLKLRGDKIELLMANPSDVIAQDEAEAVSGRKPVPLFGLPDKIEELLNEAYNSDHVIFDLLKNIPEDACVELVKEGPEEGAPRFEEDSIKAPVMRLANLIIAQAVRMKASDIHIEHDELTTHVRYRIDGVLRSVLAVPQRIGEGPLVSRIKIMADLDVADRRRPQDGRAKLLVGTQEMGLRVSTIPTAFGEKVVLRILDPRQAEVRLEALGFRPEVLARMATLSESEQGLLLITGPTGSGKTTTLYSVLHKLKSPGINIVTVEDPIEYRLAGINQVQVNEKADLSFAAVLRSVLRQDPDVVLVGEIRDRETADIAFQAALTGHMVFSTLHTNDAIATINRLIDMGVEPYKMAPALTGIVSQRLARRVCPECKVSETPNPFIAGLLREAGLPARQFKGAGCPKCSSTGLSGRTTVAELLDLSEQEARDMINPGMDMAAFRETALRKGWLLTLKQDVLWHLANGDIPLEEAAAFLGAEASRAPVKAPAAARQAASPSKTEPLPAPAAAPSRKQAAPRAGKVLVVDDNEDNRILARDALTLDGYQVTESEDGLRAIQAVTADRPDLILLDIMMPQMDGLAVLKRLRQDMGLKHLPIMIVTAMGEAESQALALDLGADDYLTKPFNHKVLRSRVRALFRRCDYAAGPS